MSGFLDATLQAYTQTTADFVQPAVSSTVVVRLGSTAWIPVGLLFMVAGGGTYQVMAVPSATQATLKLIGGIASTGATVPSGARAAAGFAPTSGSTGVTDHGDLTGLTSEDGHTQYLRTDGTRELTGNMSVGSHKLTSLAACTADTDAANKAYVDASISGLAAFNVLLGAPLTDATVTISPGSTTGFRFVLPPDTLTANRVLTLTAGSGIADGDVVFIQVLDVSAFTYTIYNGGANPATLRTKAASPGIGRVYSVQWDAVSGDFLPCNNVAIA